LHPLKELIAIEALLSGKKGWRWDMGGRELKIRLVQKKQKEKRRRLPYLPRHLPWDRFALGAFNLGSGLHPASCWVARVAPCITWSHR